MSLLTLKCCIAMDIVKTLSHADEEVSECTSLDVKERDHYSVFFTVNISQKHTLLLTSLSQWAFTQNLPVYSLLS